MAERKSIEKKRTEDVLELIERFGAFGATAEGGVTRLAASQEDKKARDFLCHWFQQNGFVTRIDAVGNIFGILDLQNARFDKAFYCGSHLDSQPHGGRYDGTLGVAFACVAALAIKEEIERGALRTSYRSFVVACWTSEEGARFQPSLLGSRVFAGDMSKEGAWACHDKDGIALKNALCEIGYVGTDTPPKPDHYLEIHIEQGPLLEASQHAIGIVNAAWGTRKLTVKCEGSANHAGPTLMASRKDALLAASRIIVNVNEIAQGSETRLHSSVGRIEVTPNSPNTVASQARLWIEFRSADEAQLDVAEGCLAAACNEISQQTGCHIEQISREVRPVVIFDADAIQTIQSGLDEARIPSLPMTTISGHDALQIQSICPSSLLFVPSRGGISHTPDEFTSNDDIEKGFEAALAGLATLMAANTPEKSEEIAHV